MKYLLDTNIILRFCNPADVQHQLTTEAVAHLLLQSHECFLTSQVLIEFWVVATRPINVNGLGWSVEYTRNMIDQLLDRFPMLEESSTIFPNWLNLVTTYQVIGKRTHDARIMAVMLSYGINHVLTLNPGDFTGISKIITVHPQDLINMALHNRSMNSESRSNLQCNVQSAERLTFVRTAKRKVNKTTFV